MSHRRGTYDKVKLGRTHSRFESDTMRAYDLLTTWELARLIEIGGGLPVGSKRRHSRMAAALQLIEEWKREAM